MPRKVGEFVPVQFPDRELWGKVQEAAKAQGRSATALLVEAVKVYLHPVTVEVKPQTPADPPPVEETRPTYPPRRTGGFPKGQTKVRDVPAAEASPFSKAHFARKAKRG